MKKQTRRTDETQKAEPAYPSRNSLGLVGTYVYLNLQNFAYYNRWGSVVSCQNSELEINQLLEVTYKVYKILDDMKIRH